MLKRLELKPLNSGEQVQEIIVSSQHLKGKGLVRQRVYKPTRASLTRFYRLSNNWDVIEIETTSPKDVLQAPRSRKFTWGDRYLEKFTDDANLWPTPGPGLDDF